MTGVFLRYIHLQVASAIPKPIHTETLIKFDASVQCAIRLLSGVGISATFSSSVHCVLNCDDANSNNCYPILWFDERTEARLLE